MKTGDLRPGESRHLKERAEPRIAAGLHPGESLADNDTVLSGQRHDVADGRESAHRKKRFLCLRKRLSHAREDCLREFERDDGTADHTVFFRLFAALPLRIDHCVSRRQEESPLSAGTGLKRDFMMIRDDYRHAELLRAGDRFHGRDPVVACDQRVPAVVVGILHDAHVHAVAVFHAVREHGIGICAEREKCRPQDVRRTDPVDVIVPDDTDLSAASDRLRYDVSRFFHPGQQKRIAKRPHVSVQILRDPVFLRDPPVPDESCQDRGDPVRLCGFLEVGSLVCDKPLCH